MSTLLQMYLHKPTWPCPSYMVEMHLAKTEEFKGTVCFSPYLWVAFDVRRCFKVVITFTSRYDNCENFQRGSKNPESKTIIVSGGQSSCPETREIGLPDPIQEHQGDHSIWEWEQVGGVRCSG